MNTFNAVFINKNETKTVSFQASSFYSAAKKAYTEQRLVNALGKNKPYLLESLTCCDL